MGFQIFYVYFFFVILRLLIKMKSSFVTSVGQRTSNVVVRIQRAMVCAASKYYEVERH